MRGNLKYLQRNGCFVDNSR